MLGTGCCRKIDSGSFCSFSCRLRYCCGILCSALPSDAQINYASDQRWHGTASLATTHPPPIHCSLINCLDLMKQLVNVGVMISSTQDYYGGRRGMRRLCHQHYTGLPAVASSAAAAAVSAAAIAERDGLLALPDVTELDVTGARLDIENG